jgi:hypothetical protein
MSFLELPSESSRAFQSKKSSAPKRHWIALAYAMSVILSCIMISFVMMNGSIFTTILVIGLTLTPTVVLFGMTRFHRAPIHHSSIPEEPSQEWEPDESVELSTATRDTITPE